MTELEASQPVAGQSLECGPSHSPTPPHYSGRRMKGSEVSPYYSVRPEIGSGEGLGRSLECLNGNNEDPVI